MTDTTNAPEARYLSPKIRAESWDAPHGTWQRRLCDHADHMDDEVTALRAELEEA